MFYLKIRAKRKEKCISQEELALRVGVSQEHISLLEKGEYRSTALSERLLFKISEALDCCPKTLLGCNCNCCKLQSQ